MVKTVRAVTGRWDVNFKETEGNYTAFIEMADGTPVTMVMNGYGFFSTRELTHGMSTAGGPPIDERFTSAADEVSKYQPAPRRDYFFGSPEGKGQPFYGFTLVSCEKGDLRQSQSGLYVYTAAGCKEISCSSYPGKGRPSVTGALLALREAIAEPKKLYPDGRWAKATLEVCLAILESDQEKRDVRLSQQTRGPW